MAVAKRVATLVRVSVTVLVLIGFAVSTLMALALIGLNSSPGRRWALAEINRALSSTFAGTVRIEDVADLGPLGVARARIRVFDPAGTEVLFVDGASARFHAGRFFSALLSKRGIDVELSGVEVDYARASLDVDGAGGLRLAAALSPHPGKAATTPTGSEATGGTPIRITVPNAVVHASWIHGDLVPAMPLDVDVGDARASVGVADGTVDATLERATILARRIAGAVSAAGDVSGRVVLGATRPALVESRFDGELGGASTVIAARLDGDRIDGSLSARLPAENASSVALPFRPPAPAAAVVTAHGTTHSLLVEARAHAGSSRLSIEGTAALDGHPHASIWMVAQQISLAEVVAGAPPSNLSAVGRATVRVGEDGPEGEFALTSSGGSVLGRPLPTLTAQGQLDAKSLSGRALVERDGDAATLWFTASPVSPERARVDAEGSVRARDLGRLTDGALSGSADAFVSAHLDAAQRTARTRVVATGTDLRSGGAIVRRAFLVGTSDGPWTSPHVDAALAAEDARVSRFAFSKASLHVVGRMPAGRFEAAVEGAENTPSASAHGTLHLSATPSVEDLTVSLRASGTPVLLGVARASAGNGAFSVKHAVVLGVGDPVAVDVERKHGEFHASARAPRVDVRRLTSVLGLAEGRYDGALAVQGSVDDGAQGAHGGLMIDASDLVIDGERGSGTLRAHFDGDRLGASLRGSWNGGEVDAATTNLRLGGPLDRPQTWRDVTGSLEANALLDLSRLSTLLARASLPASDAKGVAFIHVRASRAPDSPPDLSVNVETRGLGLSTPTHPLPPSNGTRVESAPAERLEGVDIGFSARLDRRRGTTRLELHDAAGTVAEFESSLDLPDGIPFVPARAGELLRRARFDARLVVPERRLDAFPVPFARKDYDGSFGALVLAHGTADAPFVDARVNAHGLSSRTTRRGTPLDVDLTASYGDRTASVGADVRCSGERALRAVASLDGDLPALARDPNGPYRGAARLIFEEFPIDTLTPVAARRTRGVVTGIVEGAFGSARAPHADASLSVSRLESGSLRGGSATIGVHLDGQRIVGEADIASPDGHLSAKGETPLPRLDGIAGGPPSGRSLSIRAQNFRLAWLRPAVDGIVSGLDGRLDGSLALSAPPTGPPVTSGELRVFGVTVGSPGTELEFAL